MKFSTSLSSLLLLLPLLAHQVAANPLGFKGGNGNNNNGSNNGNNNAGANNGNNNAGGTNGNNNTGNNNGNTNTGNNNGNNNTNTGGDAQTSLTLDPAVIAQGFENDGQDQPTAGQVASLTSSNNFINFCLTVPNKVITNGQQVKDGSCNPAPMGVIAAQTNMPSAKFQFPTNGATIKADTEFTIKMAISHLETGFFTNANENYFAAPQQVNGAGDIQGHSHVVVELLQSLDQTTPTDPTVFAFFKGLNDKAANGVLTADVAKGLPAGAYRLSSINSAANHQPVLVAVAQHGSLDDMVYFTVTDDGQAAGGSNSTDTGAGAASSSVAATATAVASSAAASSAAASTAAAATATVGLKGSNAGGKPGVQGGFAQGNNQNQNQNKGPQGGFGGFGGKFNRRSALNRLALN
ncbi:unnamed protein product [Somion occarium]|uniref:Uncharacterized protein n=1 Tax=Somion occarium TaxID=3059160 RepID=A0ABP1CN39_9APHY